MKSYIVSPRIQNAAAAAAAGSAAAVESPLSHSILNDERPLHSALPLKNHRIHHRRSSKSCHFYHHRHHVPPPSATSRRLLFPSVGRKLYLFTPPANSRLCLIAAILTIFLLFDVLSPAASFAAAAGSEAPAKKKKKVDEEAVKSKCTVCRSIANKFMEGLEKTKKSGYGGGNTAWEERSLGRNSFANSETRFIEIMDNVCEGVTGETEKFYCGNIVEEYEETIEEWYQSNRDTLKLDMVLCQETLRVCCPYGSWGSSCTECVSATAVSCNDQGDCIGNGTRVGTGKCDCRHPYKGEACDECHTKYFNDQLSSNETHVVCESCHVACGYDGCDGPEALHCENCASGYEMSKTEDDANAGCVDVDECLSESSCDAKMEFCINSDGSFTCEACNKICDPESGCSGGEPSECHSCRDGADWDADRKNCVVVDWQKYDESIDGGNDETTDNDDDNRDDSGEESDQMKTDIPSSDHHKEEL